MATSIQTNRTLANPAAGAGSITAIEEFAQNNPGLYAQMTALEQFNGTTILDHWVRVNGSTNVVTFSAQQEALLQQAYDALKESVYGALVVQTRLKPYLDSIGLVIDEAGVRFDTTATIAMVQARAATDPYTALVDLIDLQKYAGDTVKGAGWQPYQTFGSILESSTTTPEIQGLLTSERIVSLSATGVDFTVTDAAGWTVLDNAGANALTGGAGSDVIYAGDGNDTITDSSGNDLIYGDAGNDTITDNGSSSDTIDGGAGDDVITDQGVGTNVLRGGDGNDTITYSHNAINTVEGGAGNDLLRSGNVLVGNYYGGANTNTGGSGNDRMESGSTADTYVFNRGDGQDVIKDNGVDGWNGGVYYAAGADKIVFGAGIAASDIVVSRVGANIVLKINDPANAGATDQIMIENWDNTAYRIETLQFADGMTWDAARISSAVLTDMAGTAAPDTLTGTASSDSITGLDGDDVINGLAGHDRINGGAGNDTMAGGLGDDVYYVDSAGDVVTENLNEGNDAVYASATYALTDNVENLTLTGSSAINGTGNALNNVLTGNSASNTLNGGAGADTLVGGMGDDTYWLARGYGADTIRESDATPGNTDVAQFDSGIATDQLWFRQVGNNLEVSVIGTTDAFTVKDWYVGSQYHVEQFKTSDGKTLLDSQVQNLVQAMASFAPPAAGETTLPAGYASTLTPVIAANWQ